MADSSSDADKIRSKRLAKLGSQAPPASGNGSSKEQAQSSPSAESPMPTVNNASGGNAKADGEANPFTALNLERIDGKSSTPKDSKVPLPKEVKAAPTINISSNNSGNSTPAKRDVEGTSRSSTKALEPATPQWEDRTLSNIFRVTLSPKGSTESEKTSLQFLPGVRAELEDQNDEIYLATLLLDQILLEAASNLKKTQPLDYMLSCWKRVCRQFRQLNSDHAHATKVRVIKEARRLCMSYCIFAATMPEMFNVESPQENLLAKRLLVNPDNDTGICHEFLTEAVARFDEDDTIRDALVDAVEQLSEELSTKSMNDDFKPYVYALRNVVQFQPLLLALTESEKFLPQDLAAQDVETKTLLGPFFRLSPMHADVASSYFSNPTTRTEQTIRNSQDAIRLTLKAHQTNLDEIVRFFINFPPTRPKMLDWFALVVNSNHKRRAIQVDERYVSSDGFMVNVNSCLHQLCVPITTTAFAKVHRIEAEYFRRSPRIQIKDETKINADQATSDSFYEKTLDGPNNFISEVFFLTVAAHHYGTGATAAKVETLTREIREREKRIAEFEEDRQKHVDTPAILLRFDEAIRKYKEHIETLRCISFAIQGVMLDELSQTRSMHFMEYVIVWLIRLASGSNDFPTKPPQIPLPAEQPEVFKVLPEYFIDDIVDSFKFITSSMPHVITPPQCEELIMFCITFLTSSEYLKNPGLKSGLVDILFYGIWPTRTSSKGVLGDVMNALPFATSHLLHALMKYFIECEITSAHNQFYEKFHVRHEIFQVIRCIWSNPVYREKLASEANHNLDFFVQFVNLLLNDVTFQLDESFSAFNKIHTLQEELRNPANAGMDETARKEKEEALSESQRHAKGFMSYTTETLSMLKLFTESLADAFTTAEVVQRLADMLDYNLEALVGPKQTNLKVENPAQYKFDPKALLSDIIDVFLHLGSKAAFQLAVARDGRSYKPVNFTKAADIMKRWAVKPPEELARWLRLAGLIEQTRTAIEAEEEDLGEVPDEFMDPLMCTLMEDPVMLPKSHAILDRSTIRSHLLSDPTDPYNRTPLRIEDVVPATELKARIEAFRREHRGKKMVGAVDGVEDMDTSGAEQ